MVVMGRPRPTGIRQSQRAAGGTGAFVDQVRDTQAASWVCMDPWPKKKAPAPPRLSRLVRQVGQAPGIAIGSKIGDVGSIPHWSLLNRKNVSRLCMLLRAEYSLCIVAYACLCPRLPVRAPGTAVPFHL